MVGKGYIFRSILFWKNIFGNDGKSSNFLEYAQRFLNKAFPIFDFHTV